MEASLVKLRYRRPEFDGWHPDKSGKVQCQVGWVRCNGAAMEKGAFQGPIWVTVSN